MLNQILELWFLSGWKCLKFEAVKSHLMKKIPIYKKKYRPTSKGYEGLFLIFLFFETEQNRNKQKIIKKQTIYFALIFSSQMT